MIMDAEVLRDLEILKTGKVECANGTEEVDLGRISISFLAKNSPCQYKILELEESLYVWHYTKMLVPIMNMIDLNASVLFDTKPCIVLNDHSFSITFAIFVTQKKEKNQAVTVKQSSRN